MTGTPNQIELAGQLRLRVADEFDRVAQAFLEVARRQTDSDRADTELVLAILEEERARVMAENHAGYFIREWQELVGQVRERIAKDPRFDGILARRKSRKVEQKGIGIDAV
jgi:hypothetical protein